MIEFRFNHYTIRYTYVNPATKEKVNARITNDKWNKDVGLRFMKKIEQSEIDNDIKKRDEEVQLDIDPNRKLGNLIENYKTEKKSQLKYGSYVSLCYKVNNYLLKYLGKTDDDIKNVFTLNRMYQFKNKVLNCKKESGESLCPISINKIFQCCRDFINYASVFGYLDNGEIAKIKLLLKPIKTSNYLSERDTKDNFWSVDEWNKFISTFTDPKEYRFKLLFEVTYFEALRIGETQGLKFKDFNFDKDTLTIQRAISHEGRITTPKTISSIATIALKHDLGLEVKKYMEENKCSKDDFLFFPDKIASRTTIARVLKTHIQKANIKEITVHGLRHSMASRIINGGGKGDILLACKHLRHSSPDITLHTYSHLFPNTTEDIFK